MFISQALFDETLIESQELFEYSDEDAIKETLAEFKSRQDDVKLDHLSLTHPNTNEGQRDRQAQTQFIESLRSSSAVATATEQLRTSQLQQLPMFWSQLLTESILAEKSTFMAAFKDPKENETPDSTSIHDLTQFLLTLLPESNSNINLHHLAREVKLSLGVQLEKNFFTLLEHYRESLSLILLLVKLAYTLCNGCEPNKKTFVQAATKYKCVDTSQNGLALILDFLPKEWTSDDTKLPTKLARNVCRLLTILGKFQASCEPSPNDGEAPLVSSAHANVKELHKLGTVNKLHFLSRNALEIDDETLLCDALSAMRVMAIDNDIVQNMVAVGILDTVQQSLLCRKAISPPLAAATLGLIRNLCANDEIKTSICKQSLPMVLHAMETHDSNLSVQENGCGILAAMALRQPLNAEAIVAASGLDFIIKAMRSFPKKVPLQRQGCLAIRNISVRLDPTQKQTVLDTGAEDVLRSIASRHQGSIDEAYAALRDLGCPAVIYKVDEHGKTQGTQMFGTVKSNFRAEYD